MKTAAVNSSGSVPNNFEMGRNRSGLGPSAPVDCRIAKAPGGTLLAVCNFEMGPSALCSVPCNCETVVCNSVPAARWGAGMIVRTVSGLRGVCYTSSMSAAAIRGLEWLSSGSMVPAAASWPSGQVFWRHSPSATCCYRTCAHLASPALYGLCSVRRVWSRRTGSCLRLAWLLCWHHDLTGSLRSG